MRYYFLTYYFESKVLPKLKRINNKCENFKFEIVGTETVEVNKYQYHEFTIVEVEGKGFTSNENYQLTAILEHSIFGNIVKPINKNIEVPTKYRTAKCNCEHCNINRERKTTFLLKNVHTGEFKQVGKSCLKEFTDGINPEAILDFYDMKTQYDHYEVGGYDKVLVKVSDIIKTSKYYIDRVGYMKSSEDRRCTSTMVYNTLCWNTEFLKEDMEVLNKYVFDDNNKLNMNDFVDKKLDEYDTEQVTNYWLNQKANNDFMHNIHTLIKQEYISLKNIGYICYLYEGYRIYLENVGIKEKRKAAEVNKKDYNEIGTRYTVNIEDIYSISIISAFETEYGTTFIHKIKLYDGNEFTWFTSKSISEIPTGKNKFSFTIKDIKEYKGEEQVVITRGMFKK